MKIEVTFEDIGDMMVFAQFLAPLTGGSAPGRAQQAAGTAPAPVQQTAQPAAAVQPPVPPVQPPAPPAQAPTPPQQPAQSAVPTAAPAYTLDDLGRAGVALMESGKKAEVEALVASFGVASLQQLPEAQYGTFATALRSLGAPI